MNQTSSPSEITAQINAQIEAKVDKMASTVALKRDLDLLKVLQMQHDMDLMDKSMVSLCLFDIYRGVFAHPDMRVKSSSVTSEVQASAKLSLLAYLLSRVAREDGQGGEVVLKTFLGDLVTGIHAEIVSDGKLAASDYKNLPTGIEKFMGADEYVKLRHASAFLGELHERDAKAWARTRNEKEMMAFPGAHLDKVKTKLTELNLLLDLKIHNYRQLEKI